jgi:hypothetical protein
MKLTLKSRFLLAASVAMLVLFCGSADHCMAGRTPSTLGARCQKHRATQFRIRRPTGYRVPLRRPDPVTELHAPYTTALLHPDELQDHEVAWFRSHPEARERLLTRLTQPALEDEDPARILLWSLLENRALMPSEIATVLNQAFNLVTRSSSGKTWWVFDRKTTPQFVYIRPQMWVFLRDDEVVHSEAANTPGNGVEVHAESKGSGPFAGMFPVDNQGNHLADEFRLYYRVTYAPGMKWLEGFEDYLRAKRPD